MENELSVNVEGKLSYYNGELVKALCKPVNIYAIVNLQINNDYKSLLLDADESAKFHRQLVDMINKGITVDIDTAKIITTYWLEFNNKKICVHIKKISELIEVDVVKFNLEVDCIVVDLQKHIS